MTDLEEFVALYAKFGIACIVHKESIDVNGEEGNFINLGKAVGDWGDGRTSGDKFGGESNACSYVFFDKDGKFTRQEFWG